MPLAGLVPRPDAVVLAGVTGACEKARARSSVEQLGEDGSKVVSKVGRMHPLNKSFQQECLRRSVPFAA